MIDVEICIVTAAAQPQPGYFSHVSFFFPRVVNPLYWELDEFNLLHPSILAACPVYESELPSNLSHLVNANTYEREIKVYSTYKKRVPPIPSGFPWSA